MLYRLKKLLQICWAGPYSLLGIGLGLVGCLFGGHGRFRDGAMEFYGGGTRWFVRRLPLGARTAGITLGHVILGQTSEGLIRIGEHERVHVEQFERWGFLMGPAYLFASIWVWSQGKHIYWDNPFEKEAYSKAP